jgi:hypothetical protein
VTQKVLSLVISCTFLPNEITQRSMKININIASFPPLRHIYIYIYRFCVIYTGGLVEQRRVVFSYVGDTFHSFFLRRPSLAFYIRASIALKSTALYYAHVDHLKPLDHFDRREYDSVTPFAALLGHWTKLEPMRLHLRRKMER